MNYTTPLNFKKFHNVAFNLEFDETTTLIILFSEMILILKISKFENG